MRQVNGILFRIGELEYEFVEKDSENIHLHIPSDVKLKPDLLNDSLEKAKMFLKEYFPGTENRQIFCDSWLLAPELKELLPADSNIIRFGNAFDLTVFDAGSTDFLQWVFKLAGEKREKAVIAELPENTSLQRNMKKFLMDGGKVGTAGGFLKRKF